MRDSAPRSRLRSPDAFVEFHIAQCDQPIHDRFEQQALRQPNAVAVRLLSGDITYAQLNAAANRAARALLVKVGTASNPIAVMLNQGYESVLWTLAILKAGLFSAPLDQRLTEPVLRTMIDDL